MSTPIILDHPAHESHPIELAGAMEDVSFLVHIDGVDIWFDDSDPDQCYGLVHKLRPNATMPEEYWPTVNWNRLANLPSAYRHLPKSVCDYLTAHYQLTNPT